MLEIQSEEPHYWRSIVLERFDGFRWVRSDRRRRPARAPEQVEGTYSRSSRAGSRRPTSRFASCAAGSSSAPGSLRRRRGPARARSPRRHGPCRRGPRPARATRRPPTPPIRPPSRCAAAAGPYHRSPQPVHQDRAADQPRQAADDLDLPQLEGEHRRRPSPRSPSACRFGASRDLRSQQGLGRSGYGRRARPLPAAQPWAPRRRYEMVRAVERHLADGFAYSEEPAEATRPLRSFLLEQRTGYCQQFSGRDGAAAAHVRRPGPRRLRLQPRRPRPG